MFAADRFTARERLLQHDWCGSWHANMWKSVLIANVHYPVDMSHEATKDPPRTSA